MNKIGMVLLVYFSVLLSANTVDTMIDSKKNANNKSQKSQQTIDAYSDKSEKIYDEYMKIKKELEEQSAYNKQLDLIVLTQRKEIPNLQKQLADIEVTNRKITPLMFEMIAKLEKLVSLDIPFLKQERIQRVTNLKSYLSNPNMSTAEQFRAILESYKIEYTYSRTLEVYRSELNEDGKTGKIVDFLRVGRFALYYQSLDFKQSGFYDLQKGEWIILDDEYNELIKRGINMARKKISPDFLTLPALSAKAGK